MSVDPQEFKLSMRLWACGVTVVTTQLGDRRSGVTASSFTSVTLEPPLVLVCLQKTSVTGRLIAEAGVFVISLLAEQQKAVSDQFAGYIPLPEGADRFHNIPVWTNQTGVPILSDALAWFECRLANVADGGTHDILLGEVLATGRSDNATPLVYHNQAYRTVSDPL